MIIIKSLYLFWFILFLWHKQNKKNSWDHVLYKFIIVLIASLSAFGIWAGDMLLYPIDTIAVRMRANHSQS
jgi:hypothetical protein